MREVGAKLDFEELADAPIPVHIRAHHRIYTAKWRAKIIALRGEEGIEHKKEEIQANPEQKRGLGEGKSGECGLWRSL